MLVYMQNSQGQPLMPTERCGAVRRWLDQGRAVVVCREPFTLRLLDVESGYVQPLTGGLDVGTAHVGLSVVSARDEVLSAEVALRTDVSDLQTERRTFRRGRRGRKTPYRAPRFLHRVKVDETLKVMAWAAALLPITHWVLELGSFDSHELQAPTVAGTGYQQGEQYGFENARAYVLWRDRHTCQACRGQSGDVCLEVHHLTPRSENGSDRPANLLTLCHTCHHTHHHDHPLPLTAPPDTLRDASQFNVLKSYLRRATEALAPSITYGYLTKARRQALGLPKSHRQDAFVIAGGSAQRRATSAYRGVCCRRQNRKLFKGARSHLRNTVAVVQSFRWGDWVRLADGQVGFIYGLRSSGYFDVRRLDGTVLHHSVKAATLCKLESARTLRLERFLAERSEVPVLTLLTGRSDLVGSPPFETEGFRH